MFDALLKQPHPRFVQPFTFNLSKKRKQKAPPESAPLPDGKGCPDFFASGGLPIEIYRIFTRYIYPL